MHLFDEDQTQALQTIVAGTSYCECACSVVITGANLTWVHSIKTHNDAIQDTLIVDSESRTLDKRRMVKYSYTVPIRKVKL